MESRIPNSNNEILEKNNNKIENFINNNSENIINNSQEQNQAYKAIIPITSFDTSLNLPIIKDFKIPIEKIQKLSSIIVKFDKNMENMLEIIRQIKLEIISHLDSIVKLLYNNYSTMEIFGSSINGLDIESSDMDLSIQTKSKKPLNIFESYLYKHNDNGQYLDIEAKYTAHTPVIKLGINYLQLNNSKISELYKNLTENNYYKFLVKNKFYNEFEVIKADITLNSIKYSQVKFIENGIKIFPEIKPLMKILKKLLANKNITNSYKGGICSFLVFLLLYSYLKIYRNNYKKNENDFEYGAILMGFLAHYAFFVDFRRTSINPDLENPFVKEDKELSEIPTIIRPLTIENVGKLIYKIDDVVMGLKDIYKELFDILKDCDDKKIILKIYNK